MHLYLTPQNFVCFEIVLRKILVIGRGKKEKAREKIERGAGGGAGGREGGGEEKATKRG